MTQFWSHYAHYRDLCTTVSCLIIIYDVITTQFLAIFWLWSPQPLLNSSQIIYGYQTSKITNTTKDINNSTIQYLSHAPDITLIYILMYFGQKVLNSYIIFMSVIRNFSDKTATLFPQLRYFSFINFNLCWIPLSCMCIMNGSATRCIHSEIQRFARKYVSLN